MRRTIKATIIGVLLMALTATTALAMHGPFYGTAGPDTFYGNPGDDRIYGFGGGDYLAGSTGNDLIKGGAGEDIVRGGAGNDHLYGGNGSDRILGGPGNDTIYSVGDDSSDYVDCGTGYDTANRQPGPGADDRFVNCENFVY